MRFGGAGWKPGSRRNRRQNRGPQRPAGDGTDRMFVLILVVFCVLVLGLVVALGVLTT